MEAGRGQHVVYRFGDFELDAAQRVVVACRDGTRLKLTPRVYDTLLYLVEHAGELVTRTALLQAVWADMVVEEANLTQTIHVLRRALGESPHEQRYVATVPRRGYRFVAEVAVVATAAARPLDASPPVRGATSSWRIGRVAITLGAVLTLAALLYAQLDRAQGGARNGVGDAAAQARPAANVAAPVDPDARAYLSQARFFFYRRATGDLQRARDYLERAQRIEPRDATIPAVLSGVYAALRADGLLEPEAARVAQRTAAERALQLDPRLAEAHFRIAMFHYDTSNAAEARRHLDLGVALDPDHPLGLSMRAGMAACRGQFEEAVELQRRSVEQEPLAAAQHANLGIYLLAAGKPHEAEAAFRMAQGLNPALAEPDLALTLILQHRYAAALERIVRWPPGALRDQTLALAYAGLGRTRDAEGALARLSASEVPDHQLRLAEVLALRGERDAAFRRIERARQSCDQRATAPGCERATNVNELRLSPLLGNLHADPRWEALLAKG